MTHGIRRQPGAEHGRDRRAVQAALPDLRELLPASVDGRGAERPHPHHPLLPARSRDHPGVTIVLVVLVMGLFLRQLSATLIVAHGAGGGAESPAVAAMYLLGFSLNNLTLVALIIAVGFIVDDAIVVVENIHRHLEQGEDCVEAALTGASEIGFTVVSISFSLIAAFIPLLFMGGIVGRLFREFAASASPLPSCFFRAGR
ncbi:MAG: efflux RND transporter permease subunit [Pseudomonas sp.]